MLPEERGSGGFKCFRKYSIGTGGTRNMEYGTGNVKYGEALSAGVLFLVPCSLFLPND
jgi:hypothetical protein